MVDAVEHVFAHDMAVVSAAPTSHRVETSDQDTLGQAFACPDNRPSLLLRWRDTGGGRFDEQLAPVLADIEAEEVKALVDRDDTGLLLCQLQPSVLEELRYQGLDFLFE